jgi:hypothetical protein
MTSPLQGFVRTERLAGKAGDIADNMFNDKLTFTNDDPRAAQVATVTIDTATDTEVYSVVINGIDIPFTAEDAVAANIATGLAAAINAEPLVNGTVVATTSTADVIITAQQGGVGFTIAEGSNAAKMSLVNTTANATAAAVEFGRAVISAGLSSGSNKLAKSVASSGLTAQVQELLLTYDATVTAIVAVKVYDPATGTSNDYHVSHVMATDADTSVIALAAALNAILPANTVDVTHPTADTLTFTAEIPGVTFELSYGFGSGVDTGVWTHTIPTPGDDINRDIVGVTLRDLTEMMTLGTNDANYPGGSAMGVMRNGRLYVEIESDLSSPADGVFVRLSANGSLDKIGGFAPAAGTGLVKWEKANWVRQAGSGLAVLQVNL